MNTATKMMAATMVVGLLTGCSPSAEEVTLERYARVIVNLHSNPSAYVASKDEYYSKMQTACVLLNPLGTGNPGSAKTWAKSMAGSSNISTANDICKKTMPIIERRESAKVGE